MTADLEPSLSALDAGLAESERHAAALLARIRRLRQLAAIGDVGALQGQLEQVPDIADRVGIALRDAAAAFSFDAEAAFAAGRYVAELQAEATRQGVTLVARDDRISAFPVLLKLDPKVPGVRVGRKLERAIRPSHLIKALKSAQAAGRFNAAGFLDQLWRAYQHLAPVIQPGWAPQRGVDGPVVSLSRLHVLLTLLPAAAAEYSRDAFACDLLRLNRAPETRTRNGFEFDLPASTGSKGADRLTVFDEAGAERIFVGIRFLAPRALEGQGHGNPA